MSAKLETTQCPGCGLPGTMRIAHLMHADPVGSHSLAGFQLKFNCRVLPHLLCTQCPYRLVGVYDGTHHAVFRPAAVAVQ